MGRWQVLRRLSPVPGARVTAARGEIRRSNRGQGDRIGLRHSELIVHGDSGHSETGSAAIFKGKDCFCDREWQQSRFFSSK